MKTITRLPATFKNVQSMIFKPLFAAILAMFLASPVLAAEPSAKVAAQAKSEKSEMAAEAKQVMPDIAQVNINTASAEELTVLKGIGDAKAKAIIDYRTQNGKFNAIDDLANVSGIGAKLIEQNRHLIKL